MERPRTRWPAWSRWIRAGVALLYLAALLRVTVLKFPEVVLTHGWRPEALMLRWRFAVNLVPFRTIAGYLAGEPSVGIAVQNLAGNILVFVPWGLLWTWCRPNRTRATVVVGSALAASLVLEAAEFLLGAGSFDVDDLLLNGLGAFLGYLVAGIPGRRVGRTAGS